MSFIWLFLIGMLAQLIDGSLGMAYGVTASTLLLSFGLAPSFASASVHATEVITTFLSGSSHWKLGNVHKGLFFMLLIPGILGAIAGATISVFYDAAGLKPYVSIFLIGMGCLILYRFLFNKRLAWYSAKSKRMRIGFIGFTAAFFDAVSGGGWGPIATPTLMLNEEIDSKMVVGTVDAVEFFVTIVETITFAMMLGYTAFHFDKILPLLLGAIITAPIGAYAAKHVNPRFLGTCIGIILIITNLKTLLQL